MIEPGLDIQQAIFPFIAILVSLAISAALSALSNFLTKRPKTKRTADDVIQTTSIRTTPVPFLFGRGRIGGNYLRLGNFFSIKDFQHDTPGVRLRVLHAIIGLCEGPIQFIGNIRQDSKSIGENAEAQGLSPTDPDDWHAWSITAITTPTTTPPAAAPGGAVIGDPTEVLANLPTLTASCPRDNGGPDADNYPTIVDPVPYRRVAKLSIETVVEVARLADFNVDAVGQDLTIRRTATTGGSSFGETVSSCFYDAYSESFYYTCSAASGLSAPFGLSRIPRDNAAGHDFTQPPTAVSSSITKGWYIGRHDVLVYQDPSDTSLFHIGYWGITRGSSLWEQQRPSPEGDYGNAILKDYLDELHGILHTLHYDGTTVYVMRWNLLTGRTERLNTDLASATFTAFMYSPDQHGYIVTVGSASLIMVSADTGTTFHSTTAISTSSIKGLCVSGARIGVIKSGSFQYYDPLDSSVSATLGTAGTGVITEGSLGSILVAVQNSWTCHITLAKTVSATAAFVNFFASVIEDVEDISANGTLPGTEFQFGGASTPTTSTDTDWVRDWSYRTYGAFSQVLLEGNSSLAGAMVAALIDDETIDTTLAQNYARWGCGLDLTYFSLSSFESVHGQAVGGVLMTTPPHYDASGNSVTGTVTRYAEKYKFDFFLDSEVSGSELMTQEMLVACNGFRYTMGGKLYVGVHRAGAFPVWHFTDDQILEENGVSTGQLSFVKGADGVNRVRVQYTSIRDEYRKDFEEWNDEFNQNARGRVQNQQINANGIARNGQAAVIARQVGDQVSANRRQFVFKTHYLGLACSPGDVIEVTHTPSGLSRVRFMIVQLKEDESGAVEFTCVEKRPILDNLRDAPSTPPPVEPPDDGDEPHPNCTEVEGSVDGTVVWFAGGAAYAPGTYTINYLGGAYRYTLGGNWGVEGYDVVMRDVDDSIIVLFAAPSVMDPSGGYTDISDAQDANDGQSVSFYFISTSPIGIRLSTAPKFDNTGPDGNPTYELCLDSGSSTSGSSGSSGDSGSSEECIPLIDGGTFSIRFQNIDNSTACVALDPINNTYMKLCKDPNQCFGPFTWNAGSMSARIDQQVNSDCYADYMGVGCPDDCTCPSSNTVSIVVNLYQDIFGEIYNPGDYYILVRFIYHWNSNTFDDTAEFCFFAARRPVCIPPGGGIGTFNGPSTYVSGSSPHEYAPGDTLVGEIGDEHFTYTALVPSEGAQAVIQTGAC